MDRPTHSKARLTLAIVAALAALSALLAASTPSALAGPPASEEYVLEIPGVRPSSSNTPVETSATPGGADAGPQQGVIGETDPPDTELDSALAAIGSTSAALLIGLAALLAVVLLRISLASRPAADGTR